MQDKDALIHTHGIHEFKIGFNNVVIRLIEQINSFDLDEYTEIIACSLRIIFELSVDSIIGIKSESKKIQDLKNEINKKQHLHLKVLDIVEFLRNDNPNMTKITNHLESKYHKVSFYPLNNLADAAKISNSSSKSNLGSHKSSSHLVANDIKEIANDESIFLIFVESIISCIDEF